MSYDSTTCSRTETGVEFLTNSASGFLVTSSGCFRLVFAHSCHGNLSTTYPVSYTFTVYVRWYRAQEQGAAAPRPVGRTGSHASGCRSVLPLGVAAAWSRIS